MHTEHEPTAPNHSHQIQPVNHPPKSHEGLWSIIGTILLLVAAPLIAVVFTMFIFQSYEVDGPSMQHTLEHQDRLIVYKLPRTVSRVTGKPYIPKRGEVVVFDRAELADSSHEGGKQLIKRVIGLPGDRVVVRNGQLSIYNVEHPNGYNPDEGMPYASNITTTLGDVDLVVPENELFLVGDNRLNSLDSRYFGTVPVEDVVGELVFRLWPSSQSF